MASSSSIYKPFPASLQHPQVKKRKFNTLNTPKSSNFSVTTKTEEKAATQVDE